jgi:hypothetical protein
MNMILFSSNVNITFIFSTIVRLDYLVIYYHNIVVIAGRIIPISPLKVTTLRDFCL